MNSRWSLLMVGPGTVKPIALPPVRALTVGHASGNSVVLGGRDAAPVHCAFSIRDHRVRLDLLKGHSGTTLNGVPIQESGPLSEGDDVGVGATHFLVVRDASLVPREARTVAWDEWLGRLEEEVQGNESREVTAIALVEMPALNTAARQALMRRVREEVASLSAIAVLADFSPEVLAVLVSRPSPEALERFQAELPGVAGPRARVVVCASGTENPTVDHVLAAALDALWPVRDRPFTTGSALLIRLSELLAQRLTKPQVLVVRGFPGSGRTALGRHAASLAGLDFDAQVQLIRSAGRLTPDALEKTLARAAKDGRFAWLTAAPGWATERAGGVIDLPQLVARGDDVLLLAEAEVGRLRGELGRSRLALSDDAKGALSSWHWPGQVRELLHVVNRAARAAVGDEIGSEVLPARMIAAVPSQRLSDAREVAERRVLLETLARTRWNVSTAAARLGVPRRTLVYRMAKLKMKRPAK